MAIELYFPVPCRLPVSAPSAKLRILNSYIKHSIFVSYWLQSIRSSNISVKLDASWKVLYEKTAGALSMMPL